MKPQYVRWFLWLWVGICSVTLISSCLVDLTNLKPTDDISIIMKAVEKCKPDDKGFKILQIPAKDYEENHVMYIVYRHISNPYWGVGMLGDDFIKMVGTDGDTYFMVQNVFSVFMSKEDFDKSVQAFVKNLCENAELSKAGQFKPPTMKGISI